MSIQVVLVSERGQRCWLRPGRIFAERCTDTFWDVAEVINDWQETTTLTFGFNTTHVGVSILTEIREVLGLIFDITRGWELSRGGTGEPSGCGRFH